MTNESYLTEHDEARCSLCQSYAMDELYEDHRADLLARQDPTRQPGHQWATDREYREHLDAVAPLAPTQEAADAVRG